MSEQPTKTANQGYLRQAWLVILLGLVYGGALAGVESTLRARIDENKMKETYDRIPDLVPGADRDKSEQVNRKDQLVVTDGDGKEHRVFRAVDADGTQVGWVVPAGGQGFADRIDVLIGLDAGLDTITGLRVLDQKETPGLGNLIVDHEKPDDFCSRFKGKRTDEPVAVVKDEPAPGSNEILALSGATISSESVAAIVNQAMRDLKEPIRQLPPPQSNDVGPSSETNGQEDD
jgi:electron transport complex protein RnfG